MEGDLPRAWRNDTIAQAEMLRGDTAFVVAIVTETRRRAEELRNDLHSLIPRGSRQACRFIAFEDLTLPALLPKTAAHPA